MKKIKALLLFSGGLDSILAAKILIEQGIDVLGLTLKSYFFGAEQAEKSAQVIGLSLKIVDFSKEHLEVVKNPEYGYGKAINPCIDCHLLMLKKARDIMVKQGFDFVATGEVLGERPMSQNQKAMELIERESGLEGYLLRPLSAKLLEQTIPEKKGWVDREKLSAIKGRSRKKQIALAKKYHIKDYPNPAGGCLLCEKNFGEKLKELLKINTETGGSDMELLKIGRHFWHNHAKVIVGRNHEENLLLKKMFEKGDVLIEPDNFMGASALIRNYNAGKIEIDDDLIEQAKKTIIEYSKKAKVPENAKFKIKTK